jgi:hypothetical protein
VSGPYGSATSPCSSGASSSWYFPVAVTTKDAAASISLFNPFPADAVVDVTFVTSDGFRAPPSLQGLPIPGRQLAVIDLAVDVPLLPQIASTVATRSGQVIADELQSFNGGDASHPAGVAVHAGAPYAAPVWNFPEGGVTDGLTETFTIMNPADQPLDMLLGVLLDNPQTNGQVDPISVTVAPRGYSQVAMKDQTRIPPGVSHSVVARSRSGLGFIAERVLAAGPPSPRRGYSAMLGSPVISTRWLFPDGRAIPNDTLEFLIAQNPRPDLPVQLKVVALAGGKVLEVNSATGLQLPPGGRTTIDLTEVLNRPDATLIVTADHPVSIERALFAASGTGLSVSPGLPAVDEALVLV